MRENLRNARKAAKMTQQQLADRIRRLERICLILCAAVLLLAFFGIRLAGTTWDIVGTFDFLTEQLNLIGQKVDVIRQGLQTSRFC